MGLKHGFPGIGPVALVAIDADFGMNAFFPVMVYAGGFFTVAVDTIFPGDHVHPFFRQQPQGKIPTPHTDAGKDQKNDDQVGKFRKDLSYFLEE